MGSPRISWSGTFNDVAAECGLTAEDVLLITEQKILGDWVWKRAGNHIQCGNGRTHCSIHINDIQPFGNAE